MTKCPFVQFVALEQIRRVTVSPWACLHSFFHANFLLWRVSVFAHKQTSSTVWGQDQPVGEWGVTWQVDSAPVQEQSQKPVQALDSSHPHPCVGIPHYSIQAPGNLQRWREYLSCIFLCPSLSHSTPLIHFPPVVCLPLEICLLNRSLSSSIEEPTHGVH